MRVTVLLIIGLMLTGCVGRAPLMPPDDLDITLVAHRGITTDGYPENTLAAIRNVLDRKIEAIELDVRTTLDGELVLMHDVTVNRTTNGVGLVYGHFLNELKLLDAGDGEQVPTLGEALDVFRGSDVKILLDLKESEINKQKLLQRLRSRGMDGNVILGVRFVQDVSEFRSMAPNIPILGFTDSFKDTREFVEAGVDIVRVKHSWINARGDQLQEAHQYGLPVWVYSPNATNLMLNLYDAYGVKAVITDRI